MRESPLARILFAVYVALVIYASLYPLEGGLGNAAGSDLAPLAGLARVQQLLEEGPLKRLRAAFALGVEVDVELALIALWLFTQLNPATLLFATGDLRDIVAPQETRAHAAV